MALPIVPYGMDYVEWAKRTLRPPSNLEWRNSVKRKRIKKIKRIFK